MGYFDSDRLHQSDVKRLLYMTHKEYFYSKNKKIESKTLEIGTAVHRLLLEPEKAVDTILPLPELAANSRIYKCFQLVMDGMKDVIKVTENKTKKQEEGVLYEISAKEKDELDELCEKYVRTISASEITRIFGDGEVKPLFFKEKDYAAILQMVASVKDTPDATRLLTACTHYEKVEEYEYLGLDFVRCLDGLGSDFVLDLKTTQDPTPNNFKRAVEICDPRRGGYGYALQAASYLIDKNFSDYFIVAVGNIEPFECFVYKLKEETLALGATQFAEACEIYKNLGENYEQKPNEIQWI